MTDELAEHDTTDGSERVELDPKAPPGLLERSFKLDLVRPEQALSYGFKGGIIAFVDHDGQVYVTPGTRLKLDLLVRCGFSNPRPQIDVPYSDGSVKSRQLLKKNLPANEIHRCLDENKSPRLAGRLYKAIIRANLDGVRELPGDFLARCAPVDQKNHLYAGLCAAFRGILTFTDSQACTWVTPYSDNKRALLEEHGYQWVESMIKVPYSLDEPENTQWLAANIPPAEWKRSEKEISQARMAESMRRARLRIEKLGLKELPESLLGASAICEASFPENVGMCGSHNGILSFTDPGEVTYVTPATREKLELLKSLGYQFMGSQIKIPYSLKTAEEVAWLQSHIAAEHWDEARRSARNEIQRQELEQAEKLQRKLGLDDLPEELADRSVRTDSRQPDHVGEYFIRNDILGFVDPGGAVYVTPSTPGKIDTLKKAHYRLAVTGFPMPYSDGAQQDIDALRRHLSRGEIEDSAQERAAERNRLRTERRDKILTQAGITDLPVQLLERSVATDEQNIELIGIYCTRNDVTCFVREDGLFYITPAVPWKEQALRDAGYQPPDIMVRVPHGSGTSDDAEWLRDHLPAGELDRSQEERHELDNEKELEAHRKKLAKLGIEDKLPDVIASRCARTDQKNEEQVGHYYVENDLLGIVGPDSVVWVTPSTPIKLELLKAANYKYATQRFVIPHGTEKDDDRRWLEQYLPKGEIERSREEVAKERDAREEHLAADISKKKGLRELPPELIKCCGLIEKCSAQHVGAYFQKKEMLFFIDMHRNYYVTPFLPEKASQLVGAGFHQQTGITDLPLCNPGDKEIEKIKALLPVGELERCLKETKSKEDQSSDQKIKENIEKHGLSELPEILTSRAADSGSADRENIGRIGIYRGVMAYVTPDEKVMVTWYTPGKQETLENCGYKTQGRLPIKVPYAMPDPKQRMWLVEHLPEPDDDEAFSMDENTE